MSSATQTQTRDAILADYPLLKSYDLFIGDLRLDLQAGRVLVADKGDATACGYAAVDATAFLGWPLLSRLCVTFEMRKQGVGLALVKTLIQSTRFVRLYTSTEVSNLAMQRLIEKAGGYAIGHADMLNMNEEREVLFRLK